MFGSRMLLALAASLVVAGSAGAQDKVTLNVGMPAPPMKVVEWVKGDKTEQFQKGKLYVVEFWATWCGPCKVSIPHLTDMAAKYKGQVTFIGVDVWEHPSSPTDTAYYAKVRKFVDDMGDKMAYNVAMDGPEGTMAKTWLAAAGENGIPSSFLIGKDGKILWIGHPMGGLEQTIEKVIAGEFDAKAEAARRGKEKAQQERMAKLMGPIQAAARKGDTKAMLVEIDKVLAANPDLEGQLAPTKLNILRRTDEPSIYPYLSKLAGGAWKEDAQTLNMWAWYIVDPKTTFKAPDFKVALKLARRASTLTEDKDPMILDTLAAAYARTGDKKKAIETQQKAVDILTADAAADDATVKEMQGRLEEYRKK